MTLDNYKDNRLFVNKPLDPQPQGHSDGKWGRLVTEITLDYLNGIEKVNSQNVK